MAIDTWLLAILFLSLLLILALVRIIRIRAFYDRTVAIIVALCLVAAAGLFATISAGTLFVLPVTILFVLVCFVILAVRIRSVRGERA